MRVPAAARPAVGGPRCPPRQQLGHAHPLQENTDGRPQEEDVEVEEPEPPRIGVAAYVAAPQRLPPVPPGQAASCGLPKLRLVRRAPSRRGRLELKSLAINFDGC